MKMIKTFFLLIPVLFLGLNVHGYIPKTNYIVGQVTSKHGRGYYTINQDVIFENFGERAVIREKWLIKHGGEMHLTATGDGMNISRLLVGDQIFWLDPNKSERADSVTPNHFMVPLLTRTPKSFKKYFVGWGIMPLAVLGKKPKVRDVKKIKHEAENFVRLARTQGAVSYAYGKPTPVGAPPEPGLWIKQDSFVINKLRAPGGAEFFGKNYIKHSRNFWYPHAQTIRFGKNQVNVIVANVKAIRPTQSQKRLLSRNSVRSKKRPTSWPTGPLRESIQEFYQRFR